MIANVKTQLVLNNKPIIGILTQPQPYAQFSKYGTQYLMASYVKYIEMGGARVVPIFYDMELEKQTELYNSLNGILLPGGDVDFNKYEDYNKTLYHIYNYVLETNKKGDYFPLWGTCLGFEEIVSVAAGSYGVLENLVISKKSIPLIFTEKARTSKLFKNISAELMEIFSTESVNWNNHNFGVGPIMFKKNQLDQVFDILALNNDVNGKIFISAIEAKEYPIYSVMSHPEKVFFSFVNDDTNHSENSIKANRHFSTFFVEECKKSSHSFKDPEEEYSSLIYNYSPLYTIKYFPVEQIYFFKPQE